MKVGLGRTEGGILAAYARILPVGVDAYGLNGTFTGPHGGLGRLVVAPACRGIGHLVIDKALEAYDKVVGKDIPCVIYAQAHLQCLYEAHGFIRTGEICILDQREHVEMTRPCR